MDLSQVRAICEAAMREYGMPARIRTDNGSPFAGTGLLGLSKLSLGWMKLGIVHERIQAGRPQQNGRHERMHRTLKEGTCAVDLDGHLGFCVGSYWQTRAPL
jgi:transposase InsO family protein